MKLSEYMKQAVRTESPNFFAQSPMHRVIHAALGLTSEAGEFATAVKRALYSTGAIDMTNAKEELGDLMWFWALACDALGFDPDEIVQKNLDKLRTRYPQKFTTEASEHRDLDAERRALE